MKSLVSLKFNKILQSKSYTALLLNADLSELTIYTEPRVGQDLQIYLSKGTKPRPSSHNLIEQILDGFDIEPEIVKALSKAGIKINEIPINYEPRTSKEGKKISFKDGLITLIYLLRKHQ